VSGALGRACGRASEVGSGKENQVELVVYCYETGNTTVNGSAAGIAQRQLSGVRCRRVLRRGGGAAGAERQTERESGPKATSFKGRRWDGLKTGKECPGATGT